LGGQDTIAVVGPNGNYALTGTIDVLKAIAEGKGPSRWLIALGYAGWEGGQLEEEMTRHGWYSAAGQPGHPVRHPPR
jgi:putative transcriptional regulator